MDVLVLCDHDSLPQDRTDGTPLLSDPSLRPITIGALLTRFSVRIVLRMHKKRENMLKSNQFSYGIPGGVQ